MIGGEPCMWTAAESGAFNGEMPKHSSWGEWCISFVYIAYLYKNKNVRPV